MRKNNILFLICIFLIGLPGIALREDPFPFLSGINQIKAQKTFAGATEAIGDYQAFKQAGELSYTFCSGATNTPPQTPQVAGTPATKAPSVPITTTVGSSTNTVSVPQVRLGALKSTSTLVHADVPSVCNKTNYAVN